MKLNDDPAAGGAVTVLLATGSDGELGVGGVETTVVGDLTIPVDIPRTNSDETGTYYLHFYDDRGRIVNELDETNNSWTEGPIIVEAPQAEGYGFLGLQEPCTGMTCDKGGAVVLTWQFTEGGVPVDTGSTLPRLAFYAECPADLGPDGYPSGAVLASSSPNPTDISTGSSGWHYSESQYRWHFNFDASGLTRGACYSMYVEVPETGQVIGSPGPKPFGPFLITPR